MPIFAAHCWLATICLPRRGSCWCRRLPLPCATSHRQGRRCAAAARSIAPQCDRHRAHRDWRGGGGRRPRALCRRAGRARAGVHRACCSTPSSRGMCCSLPIASPNWAKRRAKRCSRCSSHGSRAALNALFVPLRLERAGSQHAGAADLPRPRRRPRRRSGGPPFRRHGADGRTDRRASTAIIPPDLEEAFAYLSASRTSFWRAAQRAA